MKEEKIIYQSYELHYTIMGKGTLPLLAFHGYGNAAEDFMIFEPILSPLYTTYSFHIFHHGKSKYPEERVEKSPIQKEDLKALLLLFLEKEKIDRFSLMGYSLGGKFALLCLEMFADRIEKVFLFAPDGLVFNWWYWLVSHTKIGQWIYRYLVVHPEPFFALINVSRKLRVLDPRTHKFLHFHMSTQEKREQVYLVWMTFRDLHPALKSIKAAINRHEITLHLFFGRYDTIIPVSLGKRFAKELKANCSIHIIDKGHQLIDEKTRKYLLQHPELFKKSLS